MKLVTIPFILMLCAAMSSCLIGDSTRSTEDVDIMMVYDGHVFQSVSVKSLSMNDGDIELKGSKHDDFILRCNGIGSEGVLKKISNHPVSKNGLCTLSLKFEGKLSAVFIATKGSIKRSFNRIEINVSGITDASTSLDDIKTLSAVIIINQDLKSRIQTK